MNGSMCVNGVCSNLSNPDDVSSLTRHHKYHENLYELLIKIGIDFSERFFVGLCFGILSEENILRNVPYDKFTLQKCYIYDKIEEVFEICNNGFVIKKGEICCDLIAVLPKEDLGGFVEKYVIDIKTKIKDELGIDLRIGVGMPTYEISQLEMTYKTARYAYDLYFFEQRELILYQDIPAGQRVSFEDAYEQKVEKVYRSIVAKDEEVYEKINNVLLSIRDLHYGNKCIAVNRCIMFVGELGKKLRDLNPVAANWREEQEKMQEQLRYQTSYKTVCEIIIDFYRHLVPIIYHNVEKGNVYEIMQIKEYMQKNYMRDITIKELADIMCISHSYFSTFFKSVTGKNFKTYLTEIRMEEALLLVLRTNMKTYEISEAVGYNNVRRFVDAFKNAYKMTPMEYRKVHSMVSE